MSVNELATLYMLGLATSDQENQLASETMSVCLTVAGLAVGAGKISGMTCTTSPPMPQCAPWLASKWDPASAGWKTYVSYIARSEVGNQQRRYQRQRMSLDAAIAAAIVSGLAPSLSVRKDSQES